MLHFEGSPLYDSYDHYDKEMCSNKEDSLQNSLCDNTSFAFENDTHTKNINEQEFGQFNDQPSYTKEKVSAQLRKYCPNFINDVLTGWHEEHMCNIIPEVLV